jgi:diadenosine tetraphosphate (Ap4A) HIT family hydrolase
MSDLEPITNCIACKVARGEWIPHGGFVYEDALWTVNHLIDNTPWKGWLVLQPRRHVEAFHELSPEEHAGFTSILSLMDEAVRTVLHAEKMYICLFAEALDCQHVHFHLIPRYANMSTRGPAIFQLENEAIPTTTELGVSEIVQKLLTFVNRIES